MPPVKSWDPVTDLGAGLFALQAILAAYIHRLHTGEGQYIDTSSSKPGLPFPCGINPILFHWRDSRAMGSAHRMSAPYQAIRCADGYLLSVRLTNEPGSGSPTVIGCQNSSTARVR